jgi:hypothetical protein
MNNKGKSFVLAFIAILLMLIVVFGLLFAFGVLGTTQGVLGEKEKTNPTACGDSTGKLTLNSYNEYNSSVLAPTLVVGINGGKVTNAATSGTTAYAIGTKLEVHQALGDYIDKSYTGTVECGGLTIDAPMVFSSSDNPAIRAKNDDGDYMTDSFVGSVNQTNLDAGETFKLDIEFSGTSQESSGDGVYVIEFPAGSGANITNVELSGATKTTKPNVHTTLNAGSALYVFEVPAVVGSEKVIHTLTVQLGASKDLMGGVYTDWYSKQAFIDTDGTIKIGVENADGTAKYENTLDSDFFIDAA